MTEAPKPSAYARGIKAQIPTVAIEIVLIAVLWHFIGFPDMIALGIVAAIVLGLFVPLKFKWAGSLAAFGCLAAIAYFHYGFPKMATILGILGILFAGMAFFEGRGSRTTTAPPQ